MDEDLDLCAKWKVPLVITSLGGRESVNQVVHGYGGMTLHDVTSDRLARKAIERGADGLIAVSAGAGGATGSQSPFALMQEIRAWFDGPVALSGSIATGRSVLAAQVMGADFAYIGSPFIATREANAMADYKQLVVEAGASDITHTSLFTGLPGNFLSGSITRAGLDPKALPKEEGQRIDFGAEPGTRRWTDIWGCGQGIGRIDAVRPCADFVQLLAAEYAATRDEWQPRLA